MTPQREAVTYVKCVVCGKHQARTGDLAECLNCSAPLSEARVVEAPQAQILIVAEQLAEVNEWGQVGRSMAGLRWVLHSSLCLLGTTLVVGYFMLREISQALLVGALLGGGGHSDFTMVDRVLRRLGEMLTSGWFLRADFGAAAVVLVLWSLALQIATLVSIFKMRVAPKPLTSRMAIATFVGLLLTPLVSPWDTIQSAVMVATIGCFAVLLFDVAKQAKLKRPWLAAVSVVGFSTPMLSVIGVYATFPFSLGLLLIPHALVVAPAAIGLITVASVISLSLTFRRLAERLA